MRCCYLLAISGLFVFSPLVAGRTGGYHEWHDQLNQYEFAEPQYYDVVPITPYEDPNPIFYSDSPYLDPERNNDFLIPN